MKKLIYFLLLIFFISYIYHVDNLYSFELLNPFKSRIKNRPIFKKHGHTNLNTVEIRIIRKGKHGYIAGRDVVYNDKLFKNETKDAFGVNNCVRMSNGNAPIGNDGIEVSLHHLQQKEDGVLIETESTYHRNHSKELHSYKNQSEINRTKFNNWKKIYWRQRGNMRCR